MFNTEVKKIKIFIAAPNNCAEEKKVVEIVVGELNRLFGDSFKVQLECIIWEKYVAPLLGRPEDVVLKQVKVEEWDIFIGILWTHFGTPTGINNPQTGLPYQSGTEEEFNIALYSWEKNKKPQILFYRNITAPKDITQLNAEQYLNVENFFKNFEHDKDHPGIVKSYTEINDFERRVREDLSNMVRDYAPKSSPEHGSTLNPELFAQGFRKLYLPINNEERNNSKRSCIENSQNIRLIAHSGHSFLANVSHRFKQQLIIGLDTGSCFKAVLTNPWSTTALSIAIAELGAKDTEVRKFYENDVTKRPNPINMIEKTTWYGIKFKDSINGYRKLKDNGKYNIQIRFLTTDIPASILLTDKMGFFEPYLHIDLQDRLQNGQLTFELEMEQTSHLYKHCENYFDFLWKSGIEFEEFLVNENDYKKQFIELIDFQSSKKLIQY